MDDEQRRYERDRKRAQRARKRGSPLVDNRDSRDIPLGQLRDMLSQCRDTLGTISGQLERWDKGGLSPYPNGVGGDSPPPPLSHGTGTGTGTPSGTVGQPGDNNRPDDAERERVHALFEERRARRDLS